MSTKPDGGPAFPQSLTSDNMGGLHVSYDAVDGVGMLLRDYFAAKAMQGLVSNEEYAGDRDALSRRAYELADAMLAERSKP